MTNAFDHVLEPAPARKGLTGSPHAFSLSPYQRDIWIANAQHPLSNQYTIYICDIYTGNVNSDLLKRAVRGAAAVCDAFRLRFSEKDGEPCQWIEDKNNFRVAEIDLTGEADGAAALDRWLSDAFTHVYALEDGDLTDLAVLRTRDATCAYVRTHHIVSDAWGLQFFMRQVRNEYLRLAKLQSDGAAISSFSEAVLDGAYQDTEQRRADLAYLSGVLESATPALFNRKQPNGARPTGRHSFTLERSLLTTIRERGRSPFIYFSAAVALYLAKIHQTDEVMIGIPMLNRTSHTAKDTVGHFANVLPLRVAINREQKIENFLTTLRDDSRLLLRRQSAPLSEVIKGAALLFDTTISYMRWPARQAIPGVCVETIAQTHAHDPDALAIWVSEFDYNSDVRVDFEFARDVFDDDFPIEAAARHIETLFEALIRQDGAAVGSLEPLSEEERRRLLHDNNRTEADFPDDETLPALFAEQLARAPDRTAIIEPDETMVSYAELGQKAQAVADALDAEGVGPGDRVAMLVERGPYQMPAILGIQLAGAAYVPIDPGYPRERIRLLLEDCGARAALTGAQLDDWRDIGADLPALPMPAFDGKPKRPVTPSAAPDAVAYVIYTSGSTGAPKGVMVEHRSAVNRLWWMQRQYPIDHTDVLLQKTPMSFDVSIWELFWWSFTGAALSLLPPGAEKDPEELLKTVRRDKVTVLHFVPSMLSPFLDLLESDETARRDAATLRLVFCSGEALSPAQVVRFNALFSGKVRLVNLYGPTEATVDVSYYDCLPGDHHRIPIGRPIDNTQLYVLDRQLRPQPCGAAGELYIGGIGVARGYLNRPELNTERFLANPFVKGGRMYRTGDLARWLADGAIEYLGRTDDQVKIRGNRIEPNEVRDHVVKLAGIRDAVVVALRSETRGDYLVGYYLADAEFDPGELRAGLAASLPEFMIPAYFVRITTIPLTQNGKLDRKKLPPPAEHGGTQAPRTQMEADLAAIWARTLGVADVGIFDDFYTLGGDSILMLRTRAEAQKQGLSFELADLIRNPTVAGLAQHVSRRNEKGAGPKLAPFALAPKVDRAKLSDFEDAFPVSRMSLGLIYHTSQNPASPIYHDVFRYRFALAWDEKAFRRAVDAVITAFPALRSSFDIATFSEPLHIIHKSLPFQPIVADLRHHPDPESVILEHVNERRFHDYQMDEAPLCQFAAFADERGFDVVFSFHHAILDGWSVASLIVGLVSAYKGNSLHTDDIPGLAAYAEAERASLASNADAQYWETLLDGAAFTKLDGFSAHETARKDGVGYCADLPQNLLAKVKETANRHALPVKSIFLAAHCLTLHFLTQSETVVTGVVTHGRPDLDHADRMIGLFLNTIPIRTRRERQTWLAFAKQLYSQEQASHRHRRYPVSAIMEAHGGRMNTAFNFVNLHVFEDLKDLEAFQVWEETNFSPLINVIVDPAGSGTYVRIDTGGETISQAQTELIAETYLMTLERIAAAPNETINTAFLAPRGEPAPQTDPLIDVATQFLRQVETAPEAVAVAHGDERWTYAELERMSRSIASGLIRRGARKGDVVGVALNRSADMIAAIWGIVRAGLVCAPLDVSYPKRRISLILETARPFKVIAHPEYMDIAPGDAVLNVAALTEGDAAVPPPDIGLDDLALLLFTSGSTGRPKGVELLHRTWSNFVRWQSGARSGHGIRRTLQFAPLGFDVAFGDIFSTLCSGGELRLVSDEERLDPVKLLRILDSCSVERIAVPFVALQRLAEASNSLNLRPRSLRVLITSGEQLRITDELRQFLSAMPGLVLENQYGPTEAYVVTHHLLEGDPAGFPTLPPIGKPIDGAEIRILDADMQPVPVGAMGEIWIGGACVAKGYCGAPDLTKERFADHPWRPGARLYRTGDLGRQLKNGEIVWLGRADSQVKVRGFRIEPAEVELAISRHAARQPGISEAAVIARSRGGEDAETYLVAYLTGDESQVDMAELEKALRAELPDYMAPAHFAWVDAFPLTPSGKRDDAALREYAIAQKSADEQIPPRNWREQAVAELLAELLDLPAVGVRDNFFDMGGTSLTAMRLVVTLEKRFGVSISIAALIESPTVEALAERLHGRAEEHAFDPLVPLRDGRDGPPIFMVHPLGGHVLCYMPFARALPAGQPLFALQAAGSDPGSEPLASIEEMAANYLDAVLRVRPEGPYVLAGWSFGGFVAYEMGRQLRLRDPDTDLHVVMLDSIAKPRDHEVRVSEHALLEFFYWELVWFERTQAEIEPLPYDLSTDEKLDHIIEQAIRFSVLPEGTSRVAIKRLYALFRANWDALMSYQPEPSDADMVLLRARGALPDALKPMHEAAGTLYDDPHNGWRHWVMGDLKVINVPGDHLNLMSDPHVDSVAAEFKTILDSIDRTQGDA